MGLLDSLKTNLRHKVPILLQMDGSEYPGIPIVQAFTEVYPRPFPEITIFGDNSRGFSDIGDRQDYIDSFTLQCWGNACLHAVRADIANEANLGRFKLEVPDTDSSAIDTYTIRFFTEPGAFTRVYPRRAGSIPVFSADITEIEVLGHTTS